MVCINLTTRVFTSKVMFLMTQKDQGCVFGSLQTNVYCYFAAGVL